MDEQAKIWNSIAKNVREFLKNPENSKKILLLNSTQGSGKTITTLKTLLEDDIKFAMLLGSHRSVRNKLKDKCLKDYNLFHLKGRQQKDDSGKPLCIHPLLNEVIKSGVAVRTFLCQRCEQKDDCAYQQQFETIKDEPWISVYNFLSIESVGDCIIIDENPIRNLQVEISIEASALETLDKMLVDIINTSCKADISIEEYADVTRGLVVIKKIIDILLGMLKEFPSRWREKKKISMQGIEFIQYFVSEIEDLHTFRNELYGECMGIFWRFYKDAMFKLLEEQIAKDEENKFRNIIYDLVDIAKLCLKHKNETEKINHIFKAEWEKDEKSGKLKSRILKFDCTRTLPEVPIIIIDANSNKKVYERLFSREVIEFETPIHIQRNITQIKDGKYPRASLLKRSTRLRIYDFTQDVMERWIENGCKVVYIAIVKKLSTIEANTEKEVEDHYRGKSIEHFLEERGIPRENYEICHFGNVKGMNFNALMKYGKLIIIGGPQPDEDKLLDNVRAWYEGEPLVSKERIQGEVREGSFRPEYTYKDERYAEFIDMEVREELEHTIERVRSINHPDAEVLIINNTDINFATSRMTLDEYREKHGLVNRRRNKDIIGLLRYIDKEHPPLKDFYHKVQNWKFVKDMGGVKNTREHFEKWKYIKYRKQKGVTKPKKIMLLTKLAKGLL